MNVKTWIPLVLAIVLGLVAAKVARDTLNKDKKPVAQGNFTQIVIAKRPLPPGEELSADDLTMGQVSNDSAPEHSYSNIAELLGRTVQVEMVKNQAIVDPLLADRGAGAGLQALIPAGMRAITIEVNEFSGLANMVAPGTHVDVVATIQASGQEEMSAHTIVQNVKVTAVGQRVTAKVDPKDDPNQQPQAFRSVTLLTTPEEAETIELANASGRPWLVLRSGRDEEKTTTTGVSISDLRGDRMSHRNRLGDPFTPVMNPTATATTRPSDPVAMNTRTVQVIRGGTESTVTIMLPTLQGEDVTGTKKELNDDQ